jgi:hypothetical protein
MVQTKASNIENTRNTCMQQPLAHIFQTLFQQQLGNLSEHARVKIAWARENCVALEGNLEIIINKDGGKLF